MSPFSPLWRRRDPRLEILGLETLYSDGFVAIDLETTGRDPERDAIVEVAAVSFVEGCAALRYVTHVNPERPIPPETTRVHGITDAMVARAPRLGEVLVRLEDVCAQRVLVGHGLAFDLAVLARARRARRMPRLANPALDTMRLAAALHPDWERLTFDDVMSRMGIGVLGRHTAEGDAIAAGELLLALFPEIRARGIQTLAELLWFQDVGLHSG